jgi:hypothetical protein
MPKFGTAFEDKYASNTSSSRLPIFGPGDRQMRESGKGLKPLKIVGERSPIKTDTFKYLGNMVESSEPKLINREKAFK